MELATAKDQAEQHLQRLAEHATSSRQARALQHEARRLEHKYGRKLERLAKQLPVDTPLDRHRRHRSRRRGVEVGTIVVVLAGAAAIYLVMRQRDDAARWDAELGADTSPRAASGDPSAEPTKPKAKSEPTTSTVASVDAEDAAPRSNGSTKKADTKS